MYPVHSTATALIESFNCRDFLNHLLGRVVLSKPTFRCNLATSVRVLGKLLLRKPLFNPLIPTSRSINNVRVDCMTKHNEVYSASESKKFCLDIGIERVISRSAKSCGFAASAVELDRVVRAEKFPLKVRQFDMEIFVEEEICWLNIAVKYAS